MLRAGVILTVFCLIAACAPVQAQEFRNDLSFGLGAFTFPDIAETTEDIGLIIFTVGTLTQESERDGPAYIFRYGRFVKEKAKVSFSLTYQKFSVNHYLLDELLYRTEASYYNFMLRGDYIWLWREWGNLYSGIGLGSSYVTEKEIDGDEKDSENRFAFHVNAIGCRIGKRVAGFVELGFGYEGILLAGITAGF